MGAEEAWRLSRICLEEFLSYFFTFLLILTVASRSFNVLVWNERLKTGATFVLDSFFVFSPRRVDWIRGNSRCPLVFSVLEATFQVETAAHAGVGWGGLHSSSHLTCGCRGMSQKNAMWDSELLTQEAGDLEQGGAVDLLAVPEAFLDDCVLKSIWPRFSRTKLPWKDGCTGWPLSIINGKVQCTPEKSRWLIIDSK